MLKHSFLLLLVFYKATAIIQILQPSYSNIYWTQLNLNLSKINKKLGISPSQSSGSEVSSLESRLLGLKITLGKEAYLQKFDEIDRANGFLRQAVTQSLQLEPFRQKRRTKNVTKTIHAIRKQATSLHKCLFQSSQWRCNCKDFHSASLRLETRSYDRTNENARFRLRILFSATSSEYVRSLCTKWCDVDVESFSFPEPKMLSHPLQSESMAGQKRIRLDTVQLKSEMADVSLASSASSPQSGPISDLCMAFSRLLPEPEEIGFLIDQAPTEPIQFKHQLHLHGKRDMPTIYKRSLASFLAASSPNRVQLSRGHRIQIAANLASSILQLDETPWLKSRWNSGDIILYQMRENDDLMQQGQKLLDTYLSWEIGQGEADTKTPLSDLEPKKSHRLRNVKLLFLAFALVELSVAKSLDDSYTQEDHDIDETVTRLNTAVRVLNDVYLESGSRYG